VFACGDGAGLLLTTDRAVTMTGTDMAALDAERF
jgi:hypothetical protein